MHHGSRDQGGLHQKGGGESAPKGGLHPRGVCLKGGSTSRESLHPEGGLHIPPPPRYMGYGQQVDYLIVVLFTSADDSK